MKTRYPSKISWYIIGFVIIVYLFSFYHLYTQNSAFTEYIPLIATAFILFYVFNSTIYFIEGNILTIKSTFLIHKKINILTITEIKETNKPLSAPATSLDRLQITYENGLRTLISPKDKEGFLLHIKKIQPKVIVIRK
jgi:hypothetical protein